MLAFAVRHLGAVAGIMVTASHNPPQDNGYKVYLGDGAQIVAARRRGDLGAASTPSARWPTCRSPRRRSTVLGDEVRRRLPRRGRRPLVPAGPREVVTVYTAMHGVGARDRAPGLRARPGSPPAHEVAEQVEPDPDFPTVAFPNPEEPGALDLALAHGGAPAPTSCWPTTPTPTGWRWPCPTRRAPAAGGR